MAALLAGTVSAPSRTVSVVSWPASVTELSVAELPVTELCVTELSVTELSVTELSVTEPAPVSLAPPDRMFNKDLAGLDDQALLAIVRLLPQASERRMAACELLVIRYKGLVWSCVRRYRGSPEQAEDLAQVGYVGLVKAINNFDPALCRGLATYAQPCISGEIKRHFR